MSHEIRQTFLAVVTGLSPQDVVIFDIHLCCLVDTVAYAGLPEFRIT